MKKILIVAIVLVILTSGFAYEKKWGIVWSYKLDSPMPQMSIKNFGIPSIIAIKNNRLIVPTWDGKVFCFLNRKLLWKTDLKSPISKNLLVYKNLIFVATMDGRLRAISTENGSAIWNTAFKNPITSNILIYNNILYVASDKKLYSINLSGKIVKTINLFTSIYMISKTDYFFAFDVFGRIYKLNDNLQLMYFFDIGFHEKNPVFYLDNYEVYTTSGGVILFYKNRIQYNRISLPDGIISKPVISKDSKSFYILTSFGKVFQINSSRILNYYDSQFYSVGALSLYGEKIFFSSIYNTMYVLNKNLKYIEEFKIQSAPSNNIIFDSLGGFYFLGQNGILYYYMKVMQ